MNRRDFLQNTSKAGLASLAAPAAFMALESCGSANKTTASHGYAGGPDFAQRPLPYDYKALEPHIDAQTMEIHFTKHAAAYTKNMNDAIIAENAQGIMLDGLLANISKYSPKLRNNAGGHYNHESFWTWMTPGGKPMTPGFAQAMEAAFGSVSDMKNKFTDAAVKRFGSGWAWLVIDANKKPAIGSTPNQDNPLMDVSELKGFPLLGLDVWEHAYYLKYQNKRADYITAWWNLVNWQEVENRYRYAMAK